MTGTRYPQFCALARATEIVGERWTLLIVRELLLGDRRFSDLLERLHGISPAVLSARLSSMTENGLIIRIAPASPRGAAVYRLTEFGNDLWPAVRALIRWGGRRLFPRRPDDRFDPEWALLALEAIASREPTPPHRIAVKLTGESPAQLLMVAGGERGAQISRDASDADASVETQFDLLLHIIGGELALRDAVAAGDVRVEGSMQAASDLPQMFALRRGGQRANG